MLLFTAMAVNNDIFRHLKGNNTVRMVFFTVIAVKMRHTSTHIGEVVHYHRKRAGLSRVELATLAGVGKTVIYDIERGKETVRFRSLLKVLQVLNISIALNSPLMEAYNREKSAAR